eukprot:jgi/Botrbrau1/21288/Bobra.0184s0001.1
MILLFVKEGPCPFILVPRGRECKNSGSLYLVVWSREYPVHQIRTFIHICLYRVRLYLAFRLCCKRVPLVNVKTIHPRSQLGLLARSQNLFR